MLRKVTYLFFVFILVSFSGDDLKPLFTIISSSDFFTTDNIGNTYLVKGEEVRKYSQTGDLLKIFSNKTTGKITSVDATNPLRILVFYKDFATIIILDDLLSQNGDAINLEDINLEQSDLICTSFNNGVWLFNRENMELVRIDATLKQLLNTGNLNRLLGTDLRPNFMVENNGYVYLNNPDEGILIFDIYGTYYKTVALKGLTHFQVKDNVILYFENGKLKSYNIKDLNTNEMPFDNVTDVRIEKDNYFFYYPDSVVVKATP